jgi:cellulose synthase operon protein C
MRGGRDQSISIRAVKSRRSSSLTPIRGLALAACLFAVVLPASSAADPKASRFYEDALTRYEKRDMAGAIIQLKNALQIDKSMLPVHVLLGKALLATSDVVAAEVAFTEALRLGVDRAEVVVPLARAVIAQGKQQLLVVESRFSPAGLPPGTRAQLLLLRASAYSDIGDPRSALKAVEEARAVDPTSVESWMSETMIRIRARQFPEATAAADRSLQMAPTRAEALYLRGSVAHVTGNLPLAMSYYDKALALEPTHTEALTTRAGLLIDLGRYADARRDVVQLLKSSATDPRGAYLKALLDERDGDTAGSRAALKAVTELLDPVPIDSFRFRPQVLMLGGLAHYALGEREKAKPYLEAVQRTQPSSPASKLLAQIYLGEKNVDRAIESLDLYLKGQPNDSQATLLLASAHFAQGRHARAAQLMQDALKSQDDPSMRTMLGLSLVRGGNFGNAAKELEAAFAKDPKQLQAGMALTTLYLQASMSARAVATANKLVQQYPDNAGVHNLQGIALARSGTAAPARAAFEKAQKIDPAFTSPKVNLARLERDAKAYDAAAARLTAALAADPKSTEALLEFGLLYEQRGQFDDAQRYLQKAADESGPTDVGPALTLVDFLLRNGRADLAKDATSRLTSKAPDAISVLIAVSRVAMANGDFDKAKASLTRASRAAGYSAPTLLQIATLQVQIGSLPEAAYTLTKALSERPDFLPAEALMTEVELRQGETAKAEARARQLVTRYPKSGAGFALLGDIALSRGQSAAAADHYRKAHQTEQSTESLLRVFRALTVADPSGGLRLAEQWLKTHPKDAAVQRALADAYARAGNMTAARTIYESMRKDRPDDAEVLNNLANVMLLANDPGAQAVAEQALKLKPGAAHVLGTAGWAAWKAGQPDRALQLLRDARLRDPGNPDTRYFLGTVLAGAGRRTEAREELEAALRQGRNFASATDAEKLLATLK